MLLELREEAEADGGDDELGGAAEEDEAGADKGRTG